MYEATGWRKRPACRHRQIAPYNCFGGASLKRSWVFRVPSPENLRCLLRIPGYYSDLIGGRTFRRSRSSVYP
jgi:hypothetical protein